MKPKVFQVDEGGGGISRAELHEKAVAFVEERYPRTGDVPFLWIIDDGEALVWLETPWENDREKIVSYNLIALTIELAKARSYASITEVWVASDKPDADGEFPKDYVRPGDRPENERDDAVLINTFSRDGSFDMTTFICKQQSKLLGARVDRMGHPDEGQWRGEMFDLFGRARRLKQRFQAK
ncbi:hypothetical protein V3589_14920 [Sinorhizobium fredii]|uniref:hypothetical protein n=1 Tax=Rhizobium fredii TaxID=380 RepID=UPI0030997065